MHRRCAVALGLLLACAAGDAVAEDGRKTGLVINSGPSVGVIWHLSDRVAIRPDASFTTSELDIESSGSTVDTTSVNLGVSVLFTLRRWDDLSTYVSPRFSWVRTSATSLSTSGSQSNTIETTNTTIGGSGSFGVDYRLGERFSLFGETGIGFNRQTADTDSPISLGDTTARSVGLRGTLGLVFYF